LKPSNVLVAADGQPMLLDFHLAHEPLHTGKPAPEEVGGTYAYMPPEQREAIDAVGEGGRSPRRWMAGRPVQPGRGLYEALGGPVPFIAGESLPLDRLNPRVSVGLSDVIAKCLAAEPDRRYESAAALAADLHRHLHDQPLRGVANRSPAERWRKYRAAGRGRSAGSSLGRSLSRSSSRSPPARARTCPTDSTRPSAACTRDASSGRTSMRTPVRSKLCGTA